MMRSTRRQALRHARKSRIYIGTKIISSGIAVTPYQLLVAFVLAPGLLTPVIGWLPRHEHRQRCKNTESNARNNILPSGQHYLFLLWRSQLRSLSMITLLKNGTPGPPSTPGARPISISYKNTKTIPQKMIIGENHQTAAFRMRAW